MGNANMFIAVWKKIKEENMWSSKDWIVKVDADAVFLPNRLREKLATVEVTPNGIYLDDCKKSLNYMGSEEDYGKEPWGEDLFAQRCMDLHGVDKVSAWDITSDGMCQCYRPEGEKKNKKWKPDCAVTSTAAMHPFMKPKDYFQCLKDTQR